MAFLHYEDIKIAALTSTVPKNTQKAIIPSDKSAGRYARNFIRQTGVLERHISMSEQTCTDLGYVAAKRALEQTDWSPESLDALIFMSQTPDFNIGTGNAFILHKHLGLPESCFAFDITLGCASFPFGLSVCAGYLQQPSIKRVLMISGDTQWGFVNSKEALLAEQLFLFGEGTTALLLEKGEAPSIDIELCADGRGFEYLFNPLAGFRNNWRRGNRYLLASGIEIESPPAKGPQYMDGSAISSFSILTVAETIKAFLDKIRRSIGSYDGVVFHQANLQLLNSLAKKLGIEKEKMPISIDRYGNTSGASPSLTMCDAYGTHKAGNLSLLVCAFGIGLAWGVVSMEIDSSVIQPIISTDFRFEEGFVIS